MSTHPIIKALQDELAKDAKRLALANNPMSFHLNYQTQSQAIENYKMGHEAATARLLGLLEKAVETIEWYAIAGDHAYSSYCIESGSKAREFLTTLTDASGEMNKDGK